MIKDFLKKLLAYLNYTSVSLFVKIHFRKQVKKYLRNIEYVDNDKNYLKKSKQFWEKYGQNISSDFHKWFSSCNGIKDIRYIPEDLFLDKIERYYNNQELIPAYSDKAMYKHLMPDVNQPITIASNMNGIYYNENYNIISAEDVVNKCERYKEIVMKPTLDTGGGKNVFFIITEDPMEMREKVKNNLSKLNKNFIIQEVINQHINLKKMNSKSVNTIRSISFFHNGIVTVLDSIMRMGINGTRIDNVCSGGISCKINTDGTLGSRAFDSGGKVYSIHPQGFVFSKGRVPGYDKIKSIIITEHEKLPYFRIISWDFSVDENGVPVMIEFNLKWQGLNTHQLNHGPLFGDLTEEVLDEVFSVNNRN